MDGYIYLDIWENGKISEKFEIFISSKMDNLCLEILELIVQTIYSSSKREYLIKINIKLDVLRTLIQMAYKMKLLAENQYQYISKELLESGKMVGGWLKSA